ncbi:hypothetical protein M758_11G011100 [Ceratodon purpureus]|nr:hypothetical protein M758_11G011100 [Ceratodon purpureus]
MDTHSESMQTHPDPLQKIMYRQCHTVLASLVVCCSTKKPHNSGKEFCIQINTDDDVLGVPPSIMQFKTSLQQRLPSISDLKCGWYCTKHYKHYKKSVQRQLQSIRLLF